MPLGYVKFLKGVKEMDAKKLTLEAVDKLKDTMNGKILEAIKEFETATEIPVTYISLTRKKDKESLEGCCCHPSSYDENRGPVVEIKSDLRFDI
jgi:hypothetical protein